ncbi:hypothetical protein MGYG_01838 [Nannizzia gypsea CBS 118893]|uniref:C6 zinc finger domain-containing protein n=1 Tax=Arthroderma gypseum (strain ATCC MYA-4604 / CBS 118893) TaxID=535722 RepID=E5R3X7_ARTGP|nr:hypothetical protein MGYG_01838 [Nannizzia gypsea CBS 118893]EFQ98823.1 hypothetical protein MGYG_01838 [Nannizzia gypsea CBS 118893]
MPACNARNCDEQAPCCHNCKYRHTECSFQTFAVQSPAAGGREVIKSSQRILRLLPAIPTSEAKPQDNSTTPDRAYQQNTSAHIAPSDCPETTISISNVELISYPANVPRPLSCASHLVPEEHELMHHYATTVFASLADYEAYRPIWQVIVPREMQSANFLKHGVLAISALHIHYLRFRATEQKGLNSQELSHKELAQKHYQAAVMEFGSLFPEDLSNTNAAFAFSHLTIFFAFGSAQLSGYGGAMFDAIDDLLGLFALTRKAMGFLRMKWDLLVKGDMGILLQRGPEITDKKYLPTDVVTALELLEELCNEWRPSTHETPDYLNEVNHSTRNTYHRAILQLRDCFVMLETKRKDWGMALRFPMIFPDALFPCFKAREPLAMVILAHYCVLLRRAPVRWWADGWSTQVIQSIFWNLPQDWRYAVSWPMSTAEI